MEVKGAADAEVRARKLIMERHPKALRILFKRLETGEITSYKEG